MVQQFQDDDGGNSDVTEHPAHGLTSQRLGPPRLERKSTRSNRVWSPSK